MQSEFLVAILDERIRRIGELVSLLEEKGDVVQERESLSSLLRQPPTWIAEGQRDEFAAVVEFHTRYAEDLQAIHDRLIVT